MYRASAKLPQACGACFFRSFLLHATCILPDVPCPRQAAAGKMQAAVGLLIGIWFLSCATCAAVLPLRRRKLPSLCYPSI